MPISYEAPAPVAPLTSAMYGMAQQYSQDAPLIQGARQANARNELQAGIAGAQAYNQGGEQVTQRTIAAGHINAQMEMQRQQQLFERQQQANAQEQQARMQYAQQEQQAAEQRKHYEDTVNASYQQMTQAENIRLQRLREADSWIDDQHLEPEMAASMHAQVRGLRGPLEYKAEMQQIETQKAHATLWKQQAELQHQQELKMARIETMTMDERTKHTYDPAVVAQVESDLGPRPEGGGPAGIMAQQLYDATRKRLIEANPNGIMATHILQTDGKLLEVKRPNAHADRQAQDVEAAKRHWQSVYNEQSKEVERSIHADAKKGITQLENWTAEEKQKAIANRMRDAVGAPTLEAYLGDVLGGKSRAPHVPGAKFSTMGVEGQAAPAPQAVQTAQPQGGPSNAKPFDPREPATQTGVQRDQVEYADKGAGELWGRDDLTQQQKEVAINHLNHAKKLVATFGSFERMPPQAKAEFLASKRVIESLPPEKAKPQPAKPSRPVAEPLVQPDTYAPFSY